MEDLGSGRYYCEITYVPQSNSDPFRFNFTQSGHNGGNFNITTSNAEIICYGLQIESGLNATSPIIDATTRAIETCNATSISEFLPQDYAGFIWKGSIYSIGEVMNIERNTTGSVFLYIAGTSLIVYIYTTSSAFAMVVNSNYVLGTYVEIGCRYNTGDSVVYLNGTSVSTDNTVFTNSSTIERVDIGRGGYVSTKANSNTHEFKIYSTAPTNAELISETS